MDTIRTNRFFGSAPISVRIAFVALYLVGFTIFVSFLFGLFTHSHPTGGTFSSRAIIPTAGIALLAANMLIAPFRYQEYPKTPLFLSLLAGVIAFLCVVLVLSANKDVAQRALLITNVMKSHTIAKDQKSLLIVSQQKIAEVCSLAAETDNYELKQACS